MDEAELQELLSKLFQVRLKRTKLARVHDLLQEQYGFLTQYRVSREVGVSWATVWRALNKKDSGIHLSTLTEIEDFAVPMLKHTYARSMDARDLARLILDSQSLEDELTELLDKSL